MTIHPKRNTGSRALDALCVLSLLAVLATVLAGCAVHPERAAYDVDRAYVTALTDANGRRPDLPDDVVWEIEREREAAAAAVDAAYAAVGTPEFDAAIESARDAVSRFAAAVAVAGDGGAGI